MNKPLLITIFLVALEVLFIAALLPGRWSEQAMQREAQMIESVSGRDHRDQILSTATDWYTRTLIQTGVWQSMFNMLIPDDSLREKSVVKADGWFKIVDDRLTSIQQSVYLVYVRISLLVSWLPYVPLLLIPAVWDGLMTWKIKKTNFDYASPVLHRYALRGSMVMVMVSFAIFMMPIPIAPFYIPAALMFSVVAIGIAAGNLQKRI
ncbi:uncharacterized protein DUF4400 [Marinobacter nauticus]|jgi:hypothetical protein|uniref:Uncharacterized protein DUF4400 n=1 Tax=Marinobacter nauticus TaxID=2743 RepID=A0A368X5T5_MARNT|nr:DUF4400 domain-containing protein [Marinobacter nauticus]RCW63303.1 uncharacterized protein DUF4400 [Marinobacter nauticus]